MPQVHAPGAYDLTVPIVADIVDYLSRITRPDNAAEWDPVGLQIGDPEAPVRKLAVCHEVTEAVMAELEGAGVDLLVTYHPLLFEPVNRLLAGRSPAARAFRLVGLGVSLLVTHTDFDASPGGAADSLAATLGLRDPEPFGHDLEESRPAIGRVGGFGHSLEALDAIVSDEFGHTGLRISGDRHARIDRVAVIPGSGGSMVEEAAEVADALVTGDVAHHRAVRALDLGLSVVDPGHIATERPGIAALAGMMSEVPDVEFVDLTHITPATWS